MPGRVEWLEESEAVMMIKMYSRSMSAITPG